MKSIGQRPTRRRTREANHIASNKINICATERRKLWVTEGRGEKQRSRTIRARETKTIRRAPQPVTDLIHRQKDGIQLFHTCDGHKSQLRPWQVAQGRSMLAVRGGKGEHSLALTVARRRPP